MGWTGKAYCYVSYANKAHWNVAYLSVAIGNSVWCERVLVLVVVFLVVLDNSNAQHAQSNAFV
jgi:hypothetical protein